MTCVNSNYYKYGKNQSFWLLYQVIYFWEGYLDITLQRCKLNYEMII